MPPSYVGGGILFFLEATTSDMRDEESFRFRRAIPASLLLEKPPL